MFFYYVSRLSRLSEIVVCLKSKWPVQVQIVKSSLKTAFLLSHRKVIFDSAELDCVRPVDNILGV